MFLAAYKREKVHVYINRQTLGKHTGVIIMACTVTPLLDPQHWLAVYVTHRCDFTPVLLGSVGTNSGGELANLHCGDNAASFLHRVLVHAVSIIGEPKHSVIMICASVAVSFVYRVMLHSSIFAVSLSSVSFIDSFMWKLDWWTLLGLSVNRLCPSMHFES